MICGNEENNDYVIGHDKEYPTMHCSLGFPHMQSVIGKKVASVFVGIMILNCIVELF